MGSKPTQGGPFALKSERGPMRKKQLLVLSLVAAILVGTSFGKSASALPLSEFPTDPHEQRAVIVRLITEIFPSSAVKPMLAIAECESTGMLHVREDGLVKNRRGTGATGVLQVEMRVHHTQIARLRAQGTNVLGDVHHYIQFSHGLFEEAQRRGGTGFEPWPSCGRRFIRAAREQAQRQRRTRPLYEVAQAR